MLNFHSSRKIIFYEAIMQKRYFYYSFFILGVILSQSLNAPERDQIRFGNYLTSDNLPDITFHQFNDPNLLKFGFNSLLQTVMGDNTHKDSIVTNPIVRNGNRAPLSGSTVDSKVVKNGGWVRVDADLDKVDWLKILSHGVYNKWEVEGNYTGFYPENTGMNKNLIYTNAFNFDGRSGLVSDFGPQYDTVIFPFSYNLPTTETVLVSGPGCFQNRTYKIVHKFDDNVIRYTAKFRMRLGRKPTVLNSTPVCLLRVKIIYPKLSGGIISSWDTTILAEKIVKSYSLDEIYQDIPVSYSIKNLGKCVDMNLDFPYKGSTPIIAYNASRVYFEVVIPVGVNPANYGELFIDNIAVMDDEIWGKYGSDQMYRDRFQNYNENRPNPDLSNRSDFEITKPLPNK